MDKKNKKVYISGKITGLDYEEVERRFNNAQIVLECAGLQPVNPLKVCEGMDVEKHSWTEFMMADIKALFECRFIYMLSNWGSSKGARVEYAIAQAMGIKVMFEDELSPSLNPLKTSCPHTPVFGSPKGRDLADARLNTELITENR